MSNVQFYKNLKPISDFHLLADSATYRPFPDSWNIVASDIRNSTKQIKTGKFKQVNMIAASVIAAISNQFKNLELPYVFEGDGSLIAIPDECADEVRNIIEVCIQKAFINFNLELAAGIVSVNELIKRGYNISVAKFQLSENITQSAFWGNGISQAEQIIKSQKPSLKPNKNVEVDLTGLECRWNYFPAKNEAVSLIIQAIEPTSELQSKIYRIVLEEIEALYGKDINLKPVRQKDMKLTFSPRLLSTEIKMKTNKGFLARFKYGLKLMYLQFSGFFLMKFNINTKKVQWKEYQSDFIENSDYRKFSGDLKMVINGTVAQKEKLIQFLENLYQQKKLIYGIHASKATISTCYITEYQNNHIHFIDGADGGYTKASVDFKRKQSELEKMAQ